ncbi:hypothetical protein BC834DRAFT_970581 [Gloeopeniophorella convolvens]|nr:hypothetical protein BC834DRAFT_970581 [Gloeopeniophorella convolvens]
MDVPWCETHQFYFTDASALSAYIILYYDYFLTLSDEVDRFWCSGPRTWGSAIFLANRYLAVLGHLPLMFLCYANPCTITWVVTQSGAGKDSDETVSQKKDLMLAFAFVGLLVFDFTVFVLTVWRSIRLRTHNEPFLDRLFIDGFMYYGVIWNLNLVNIILLVVVDPSRKFATPTFTNVLSVIMISRLMINLRDPNLRLPMGGNSEDASYTDGTSRSGGGDVSTFVHGHPLVTAPATQTESGIELGELESLRIRARESALHSAA